MFFLAKARNTMEVNIRLAPKAPDLSTFKYLSVHLDLRNDPTASLKKVKQDADKRLSHLIQQPASPTVKIDNICFKKMPIIMYSALCANWRLAQYKELLMRTSWLNK
jgi:hypothetical protein